MSNRNLKIIAVILATFIAICTVTNCYVRSEAAATTAGTYTAIEVLVVLLAAAGVTLSADTIQNIWDGGELNIQALLNNMRTYSQLLYSSTLNYMQLGSYGVTKLVTNQRYMGLLKTWAKQYFGSTVGANNTFGTVDGQASVYEGYEEYNIKVSFVDEDNIIHSGQLRTYMRVPYIVFYNKNTQQIALVPYLMSDFRNMNYTAESVYYPSNIGGYTVTFAVEAMTGYVNGHYSTFYARKPALASGQSDVMANFGNTVLVTSWANNAEFCQLVTKYYNGELTLNYQNPVSGKVLDGINNAAAVLQSIIGAGTRAIDDDGETKLEGDLVIGLPLAAAVAALLSALSVGEKTYSDFLSELGLQALDGTETIEDINEQAAKLPIPTPNGVYTLDLTGLFPFCIPFDIVRILSAFNANPEAPHFNWTLPTGYQNGQVAYETYTIDLSQFDTVAQVVRVFEYISFVLGLAIITRDLIRG